MPTLGEILGNARRSTSSFEGWLQAADPEFAQKVQQEARGQGQSVAQFARWAVADFDRFAGQEAWAQLMTRIRDNEDPGRTCLSVMVHWHLTNQHTDSKLRQTEE